MRKIFIMILAIVLLATGCSVLPTAGRTDSQLADMQADYDRLEGKYDELLLRLDNQEKKMLQDKETIRELKSEIKHLQEAGGNNDEIEELLAIIEALQDEIDYLRANPPVCENILLTEADLEELRYMPKRAVLDFFGDDYIYGSIADGVPAYIYDDYFIVFDDYDNLEVIVCPAVELDGYEISLGLTFDDVQQYFGYIEIYEVEQVMPDDPHFVLVYDFGDFILWMGSDEVDGMISHIQIRFF